MDFKNLSTLSKLADRLKYIFLFQMNWSNRSNSKFLCKIWASSFVFSDSTKGLEELNTFSLQLVALCLVCGTATQKILFFLFCKCRGWKRMS